MLINKLAQSTGQNRVFYIVYTERVCLQRMVNMILRPGFGWILKMQRTRTKCRRIILKPRFPFINPKKAYDFEAVFLPFPPFYNGVG